MAANGVTCLGAVLLGLRLGGGDGGTELLFGRWFCRIEAAFLLDVTLRSPRRTSSDFGLL